MSDEQKNLENAISAYAGPGTVVTGYVVVWHSTRIQNGQEFTQYGYASPPGQTDHTSMGLVGVAEMAVAARVSQSVYGGFDGDDE